MIGLGQALVERFDGEVPGRLDDLVTLPGVGRKTANVVLGNAFGVPGHHRRHPLRPAGAPVRLDRGGRPGQGRARDRALFPKKEWTMFSHRRDLPRPAGLPRQASRPAAPARLAAWCPSYGIGPTDPEVAAAKLVKTPAASDTE